MKLGCATVVRSAVVPEGTYAALECAAFAFANMLWLERSQAWLNLLGRKAEAKYECN